MRQSDMPKIDVKQNVSELIENYGLVFSAHCKQIFPYALTSKVRCVNAHPGYNPYNRGWFPHIFSILNGLPTGITIHEMDEHLDHGKIIVQQQYEIKSWDTSESIYAELMQIERKLLLDWFPKIRDHDYKGIIPDEGNIHYKKDFDKLRELKLDQMGTLGEHIDLLRALSHGIYRNAYFSDSGEKVYLHLSLEKE